MNVGLIGLGAMGRGMAQSLRRKGFVPRVFDVRADAVRDFVAQGGTGCATATELARDCDVVISVVVNAAQTEAALFGEQGAAQAMRHGSVFVMCSTVDPDWSIALEARLEALGIHYLDAPIPGGAAKAASCSMPPTRRASRCRSRPRRTRCSCRPPPRGTGARTMRP